MEMSLPMSKNTQVITKQTINIAKFKIIARKKWVTF
jgi:hypothetical protein